MEAIWIIPLFFIFPLLGIVLSIIGFFRIRNGKSKNYLFIGLTFLSLPILYLLLTFLLGSSLEKEIIGKYTIGNHIETLTVNEDHTFDLNSSINFQNNGKGTWEIQEIDFPILILKYNSGSRNEMWLVINKNEEHLSLSSMAGDSTISNDLIKEY